MCVCLHVCMCMCAHTCQGKGVEVIGLHIGSWCFGSWVSDSVHHGWWQATLPPEPSCQPSFAFKCMYLNSWISECTFQYCALHYVTAFPGEAKHTCLLIPDTYRSKDGYCQGPTWWTVSFIGVTQRNVSERFLILIKVEMTQRQLYHQSSPQHGWQLKSLGTWNTLHGLQAADRLDSVLPRCLSLSPGSWSGLKVIFAAGLCF